MTHAPEMEAPPGYGKPERRVVSLDTHELIPLP